MRWNARSRKVDFSVPLPDFKQHWTTLLGDDRLFPSHSTVSYFFKSSTSVKKKTSLNYVSAKHLLSPCPPSLYKALYKAHLAEPDADIREARMRQAVSTAGRREDVYMYTSSLRPAALTACLILASRIAASGSARWALYRSGKRSFTRLHLGLSSGAYLSTSNNKTLLFLHV